MTPRSRARRPHLGASALALAPALVLTVAVLWVPMMQVVAFSFTDFDGFLGVGEFVGLDNFIRAFSDPAVGNAAWHSLIYSVFYIVVQLAVAFALAVAVSSVIRGSNIYRSFIFIPVVISPVAAAFAWEFIYDPGAGAFNGVLEAVGLGALRQNWLGDYDLALYSVILVDLWKSVGFFLVIFLAGLSVVPSETIEAGRVDGANGWQILWRITIPQLKLTFGLALVLAVNGAVRAFDTIYLLTGGGPGNASDVYMLKAFREAFANQDFGYGSALAVLALVVLVGIFVAQRRLAQEK